MSELALPGNASVKVIVLQFRFRLQSRPNGLKRESFGYVPASASSPTFFLTLFSESFRHIGKKSIYFVQSRLTLLLSLAFADSSHFLLE